MGAEFPIYSSILTFVYHIQIKKQVLTHILYKMNYKTIQFNSICLLLGKKILIWINDLTK